MFNLSKTQRKIDNYIDLTKPEEDIPGILMENEQIEANDILEVCQFKKDPDRIFLLLLNKEKLIKSKSVKIEGIKDNQAKKVQCEICKLKFSKFNIKRHLASHSINKEKCKKCKKMFTSKIQLGNHHCNHCHLCGKEYDSKYKLNTHLKRFHHKDLKITTFKCDLCGKLYYSKDRLIEHIKVTHPNGKILSFVCDHDGKVFITKPLLSIHIKACHVLEKCKYCDNFFKKGSLKTHIKNVHGVTLTFDCKLCNYKLRTQKGLDYHMINEHKNQNECKFCDRKFKKRFMLNDHMIRMHSINQNDFRCEFCKKKFYIKSKLDQHIKATHPKGEIKKFICDYDGRIYFNRQDMHRHIKMHYSKVKCKVCNKESAAISMSSHMKTQHPKNSGVTCKICSKIFRTNYHLSDHLKSHNKQHECEICLKKFATRSNLNYHKRIHSNVNLFTCNVCQKGFKYEPAMRKHMRIHLKDRPKPFMCPKCEYSTDEKCNLVRHIKTHDNFDARQKMRMNNMKNPVKCDECVLFFSDKHKLKTHKKNIHSQNKILFQCDLCAAKLKHKSGIKIHLEKWCKMLFSKF
ncbi:hypothetical protein PVAND_009201 [Polypedilum vanderplanki]|uniref:C2H2-type domain-containing protein n=1 Tax=Polypedilum vanderplanki TaxID=319348 RepID=A0A9J6CBZ1_POLVA|nr:hypothetical protein PVAND_009201 [Polypedilum vanderplanki]